MRLMPFRVAADHVVGWRAPVLVVRGESHDPGEEVRGWDYLTEVTVEGALTIRNDELLNSTGLVTDPGLSGIRAVMRVDCSATSERFMDVVPLDPTGGQLRLTVRIPAGAVAEELEVRYEIVLDVPDGPVREDRAAHQRGSRLHELDRPYRFRLEGSGSAFPIEAFEFTGGEFPKDSVWLLRFQDEDLAMPYLSAVRLYVNTAHEEGRKLVDGSSGTAMSVLKRDVLLQLLTRLAVGDRDDLGQDFQTDSAGEVIGALCALFLDQTLPGAVELMRDDPGRVFALLQASTNFLGAGS